MIGHRCSALPIAQFCGLAPVLSAKHGSGRSAAMSSAFHDRAANQDGWDYRWHRLTPEEQKTVDSWKLPADIILDGNELRYEDAYKEIQLGLSETGEWEEYGSPAAVTAGTADMYWVCGHTLYLSDIKRTRWTQTDPMNLQNLAYGFAAASLHGCAIMRLGLWYAEEGEWNWGEPVSLVGQKAYTLLQRVLAAATNKDEQACVGAHCDGCYARKHCPEYMLPPAVLHKEGISILAEVADSKGELTSDQALALRRLYERGSELLEAIKPVIKAYAKEHGGIRDEEAGKIWTEIHKKGRKTVSLKLVKERYPEVAEECTTQGALVKAFVWKKI